MSQPTSRPAEDAWKTAAIREAESALDRTVSKSRQLLKDLEKIKLPPVDKTASPEKIAALQNAASKPDAPPQLKLIKRKVDAGEFTWKDVAEGKAFADPEVRELAMGKLGETKEMYDELKDGASPEELLEARTGGVPGSPLAGTGHSSYAPQPTGPAGYSAEDPLASSSQPAYPAPAEEKDEKPAEKTPEPPEPPKPERTPPPARHRAPEVFEDDEYTDPLSNRGDSAPPPSSPPPSSPPPSSGRRARRDDPVDDDDYFGGSHLS